MLEIGVEAAYGTGLWAAEGWRGLSERPRR
jgi:hypothetical protein